MHPIEHIRKFVRMTPEVESALLDIMQVKKFRKGETVRGAVNLSSYAIYILSGSARTYMTIGGKEHTMSFSFENEFMVASKVAMHLQPDTVAIEFLENTEVIYIPHLRIKDVLEESKAVVEPAALLFLSTALIRYNNFLDERIYIMQTLNATERYKWLITRYPRILSTATVTQIASYLGLTKETLYRIRNNNY